MDFSRPLFTTADVDGDVLEVVEAETGIAGQLTVYVTEEDSGVRVGVLLDPPQLDGLVEALVRAQGRR